MSEQKGKEALERAKRDENLVLIYQPIHELQSKRIVAAEALLRQRRQNGELREAHLITKTAERSVPDLRALDSLLMHQAYTDFAVWHERGVDGIRLNVNLSPREFQEPNLVSRLKGLVTSCGIELRMVNIEVTETTYIDKPEETCAIIGEIADMGAEIWLDDFGTGHSSIEHLLHFKISGFKIPATFVQPLPGDKRAVKIVKSLVALAHDLGVKIIAEGVEKEDQLAVLAEAGADLVQGFLFSKPMPSDDFVEAVLANYRPDLTYRH